ncbi:hypothetical protein PIROE2DRAFT_17266 [Piromyces sp. E2]|nr:hypothetical protein PIROE2DRAFT_17266 [Piromyces sp. E2]|eukprot:OUM57669.1 hypothetical protein PIROE2DRAFT_17266 [Piromyces sp. E2]
MEKAILNIQLPSPEMDEPQPLLEPNKNYGPVFQNGPITIDPSFGYDAMEKATVNVQVPLNKRDDAVDIIKKIITFGLSQRIKDNAQCNKDGAKYNGRSTECKFNCYSEPSKACKNALD